MNLQGVRGPRALQIISEVLEIRELDKPVLVVAASASDLLAVGLDRLGLPLHLVQVGEPSPLAQIKLTVVAQDRLVADQRFEAAIEGLSEQSAIAASLVAQAQHCWWTLRQVLDADEVDSELQRFQRALERVRDHDPLTADLFTSCRKVLHTIATDELQRSNRLRAVIQEVLEARTAGPILVLARTWKSARKIRAELAIELELAIRDLEELGVFVSTVHSRSPRLAPDLVVLVGYAGLPSIDAALASGASRLAAILDPVETRAAWYGARRMVDCLTSLGANDAIVPVERIAEGLSDSVTGFGPVLELEIGRGPGLTSERAAGFSSRIQPAPGDIALVLTDGTVLYSSVAGRFEVLGSSGYRSRVVAAADIEPGDQIVLVDEDSRLLFSEQRMVALDKSVLKEENAARQTWIDMVRSVAAMKELTPTEIAGEMEACGYPVSVPTVRTWLEAGRARAPIRFGGFVALAASLGLDLQEEVLRHFYNSVRRWRVRHRLAGRRLTQAIRLAQSGRLGAVTQARIEHDWGIEIRELIEAARLVEVDEVIHERGTPDGDQ